jgi:host factor-I protein
MTHFLKMTHFSKSRVWVRLVEKVGVKAYRTQNMFSAVERLGADPYLTAHGACSSLGEQRKYSLLKTSQKEIGMDTNKPAAQNIQDSFLNTARKEKQNITIYLISGVKLTGRIRSFDKYSVVLETSNQEQLIFKHAISTVVMGRSAHGSHGEPRPAATVQVAEASASGTEG